MSVSPQHCVVWCLRSGFPSALTRNTASCHSASPSTLDGWALFSPCWAGPFLPVARQSPRHLAPTRTTIVSTTPNREVATRQQPPPPIMPRAPTSEMGEILSGCVGDCSLHIETYTLAHTFQHTCTHKITVTQTHIKETFTHPNTQRQFLLELLLFFGRWIVFVSQSSSPSLLMLGVVWTLPTVT